jgi:hypothetical protein
MNRNDREKKTVECMIRLYCRKKHKCESDLCQNCTDLLDYARERLTKCHFGDNKPPCAQCPIHCYKSTEREEIRKVMRFAGPRMIFHNPLAAIMHIVNSVWIFISTKKKVRS